MISDRLFLLAKRHRYVVKVECSICQRNGHCAKLLRKATDTWGEVLICGQCASEIRRIAIEGKKEK